MKAKVIKRYRDKNTNLLQEIGAEVEVTNERFKEINSTSHGAFLTKIEEDGEVGYIDLEKMNKAEIVEYAKVVKGIELSMNMTKTKMIQKVGG